MSNINTAVIHYSATYPDQDYSWRSLSQDHIRRGFREGGYHWYIRRNGNLIEGRAEGTMGAGVRGHNGADIVHICWEGGLERATGPNKGVWNPTPEQEATLIRLLTDMKKRHPKLKTVVGHIDLAPTQCPGLPKGGVAKWWEENKPKEAKHWIVQLILQLLGR